MFYNHERPKLPDKPVFNLNISFIKVELTWDETDRDRISITRKKIPVENINDDDFKAYLASSSEDESGERAKYQSGD